MTAITRWMISSFSVDLLLLPIPLVPCDEYNFEVPDSGEDCLAFAISELPSPDLESTDPKKQIVRLPEFTQLDQEKWLAPGDDTNEERKENREGQRFFHLVLEARCIVLFAGPRCGIANNKIPHTIPFIITLGETFDVGVDTRTPVDDKDYQVPFRFTGKISKVTIKLGPEQLVEDDRKHMQEAINRVND